MVIDHLLLLGRFFGSSPGQRRGFPPREMPIRTLERRGCFVNTGRSVKRARGFTLFWVRYPTRFTHIVRVATVEVAFFIYYKRVRPRVGCPFPGSYSSDSTRPGKMDVETPPNVFIDKNTKFRSGLGYVLNLTGDQLAKYLNGFKGNYSVLSRNCGDPLVTALRSIGIDLVFDKSPFATTPNDLDYAFGHTPGLVTGWVPHPQVGK
jgi:hypothetical protein